MQPGFVIRTSKITAIDGIVRKTSSKELIASATSKFSADKDCNLVFVYLGQEDSANPLSQEGVLERMNAIGWRQMTIEETDEFENKTFEKYGGKDGVR